MRDVRICTTHINCWLSGTGLQELVLRGGWRCNARRCLLSVLSARRARLGRDVAGGFGPS